MQMILGNLGFEFSHHAEIILFYENHQVGKVFPQLLSEGVNLLSSPEAISFHDPRTFASTLGYGSRYSIKVSYKQGLTYLLNIDYYPQWPDTVFLKWHFENRGSASIKIERVELPCLDLPRFHNKPVWTLQGAAVKWGQDFAFELPASFQRDNYLGHLQDGEGGGIPVNDFWSAEYGIALAHAEPLPHDWFMPVEATFEKVITSLQRRGSFTLQPGESFSSLQSVLIFHRGDFFEPISRYREILEKQGLQPAPPSPEDFEPAWCSWGYEFDVRPEEVESVLPMLKRLGIHWVTLDDRWFDHYGDWNPRPDTFPGGKARMSLLVERIHQEGMLAQLWWYPLCAEDGHGHWDTLTYGYSQILKDHPDWVVINPDGSVARNNRHLAMLCPALPEVQEYTLRLVQRFIGKWGFDGFKLDNIYTMPSCYNPAHHHSHPEESMWAFGKLYQQILTESQRLCPHAGVQICPCGTPITFSLLPATTQTVTADPISSAQVRQRIKFYKALMGSKAAVFADHVELTDGGIDFASQIGAGGVPGTKFIWPEQPEILARLREVWLLTPEKEALWEKWFRIYNHHRPAEGEYLNLYDSAFDQPEAHVLRKGQALYYAFFAPFFKGDVELRGLEGGKSYRVEDYTKGRVLGVVSKQHPFLSVKFEGSLLMIAIPENS